MKIAWQLLQWQLAYRLANERSGGQCMYLAGASMMTAVSPDKLKHTTFMAACFNLSHRKFSLLFAHQILLLAPNTHSYTNTTATTITFTTASESEKLELPWLWRRSIFTHWRCISCCVEHLGRVLFCYY
jgi:hypothetical protein